MKDGANAANGNYDFEFVLFDAAGGGTQIGSTITRNGVAVANGIFSVNLDFGSSFPGANRFLEIHVRQAGGGAFTALNPRQSVTSAPYSVKSLTADSAVNATNATTATTANNALQLGGVAASQYVVTTDPRMSNARNPIGGSTNYIQNTTQFQQFAGFDIGGIARIRGDLIVDGVFTANLPPNNPNYIQNRTTEQEGTSNFNIRGNGTVIGTLTGFFVNAVRQYNIGDSGGSRVLSSPGVGNIFVGFSAGAANDDFGGDDNSFVGVAAGVANTDGNFNSFFGRDAGKENTSGNSNSFFGVQAGRSSTGSSNSFFGAYSGNFNTTGSSNTTIGAGADVGQPNLTFATAIGAGSTVALSNTIALGRIDGSDRVFIWGLLDLNTLDTAGNQAICRNTQGRISTCSSSFRYKTNIGNFTYGLDLVKRLKPITFDWKDGGMHDLGLGAEDVAAIEPLLVTYNANGEVEGVKYDRIGVVLINAVNEQQTQITSQQKEIDGQKAVIEKQQTEIDLLRAHICSQSPSAIVCRPRN